MAKNWWQSFVEYIGLISPVDPDNFKSDHTTAQTKTFKYSSKDPFNLDKASQDEIEVRYQAIQAPKDPQSWRIALVIWNDTSNMLYVSGDTVTLADRPYVGGLIHEETRSDKMSYKAMLNEMRILEGLLERNADFEEMSSPKCPKLNAQNYHQIASLDGFLLHNGQYDHKSNHDNADEIAGVYLIEDNSPSNNTAQLAYTGFSPEKIGHFGDYSANIGNIHQELDGAFHNFNGYVIHQDDIEGVKGAYEAIQQVRAIKYGLLSGGKKQKALDGKIIDFRKKLLASARETLQDFPRESLAAYDQLMEKHGKYAHTSYRNSISSDVIKTKADVEEMVKADDENIKRLNAMDEEFNAFKSDIDREFAEREKTKQTLSILDGYMIRDQDLQDIEKTDMDIALLTDDIRNKKYKVSELKSVGETLRGLQQQRKQTLETRADSVLRDKDTFELAIIHYQQALQGKDTSSYGQEFKEAVDALSKYFDDEQMKFARYNRDHWVPIKFDERIGRLNVMIRNMADRFGSTEFDDHIRLGMTEQHLSYISHDDSKRHRDLLAEAKHFREKLLGEGQARIPQHVLDALDKKRDDDGRREMLEQKQRIDQMHEQQTKKSEAPPKKPTGGKTSDFARMFNNAVSDTRNTNIKKEYYKNKEIHKMENNFIKFNSLKNKI